MNPRRVASIGSALVVAGIAALASYAHMRGLAIRYGQTEVIADLLPISVDGMMVVATLALGDGRRYRWSAWLAFWIGVVASVIANVLAAEPSVIARCISAWPAVAFLLVVEVITRGGRLRATKATEPAVGDANLAEPAADELPPDPWAHATPIGGEPSDSEPTAEPTAPTAPRRPARRPAKRQTAADRVVKAATRTPSATPAELAARLKISERTVQRHLRGRADDTVTTPQQPSEQVNGATVADLITTD